MRKIVYGLLFLLFVVTAAGYAMSVSYIQSDRTRQNVKKQTARAIRLCIPQYRQTA